MLAVGAFVILIAAGGQAAADTSLRQSAPVAVDTASRLDAGRDTGRDTIRLSPNLATLAPADTPHVRVKAIEVSDWYSRRLTVHRWVSYATIPVFAVQYAAGNQLYKKGNLAPTWAKTMHRVGATSLAGMFGVNTVTGVWNWWDSRSAPQGRVLRTVHAISMLTADAAFTYAGAKLSNEAETDASKRKLHRTIALDAMGLTMVSALAMKLWNR